GFNAFREKFFPDLGKSRVYELLSIATNKKSSEDIKAGTRKRVADHRARKRNDSVTVTEKPSPTPEPQDGIAMGGKVQAEAIITAEKPEPAEPRCAATSNDEGLLGLSIELKRASKGEAVTARQVTTEAPSNNWRVEFRRLMNKEPSGEDRAWALQQLGTN